MKGILRFASRRTTLWRWRVVGYELDAQEHLGPSGELVDSPISQHLCEVMEENLVFAVSWPPADFVCRAVMRSGN